MHCYFSSLTPVAHTTVSHGSQTQVDITPKTPQNQIQTPAGVSE